jgi:hypothetical protein
LASRTSLRKALGQFLGNGYSSTGLKQYISGG